MKHIENVTYEFTPDPENEFAWHIRILEGMFNETVIQYGAISIGEENDDGDNMMTFNFHVVSSPDSELTSEDKELQEEAGNILLAIIEASIENKDGSMVIKDKDDQDAEWEYIE